MSDEDEGQLGEETTSCHVFISYRIDRDEAVASALKTLIERTVEPAPIVFAASLGGVLPSAQSWRSQTFQAIRAARVFIAIITQASRAREWINFEAGAAWARGAIYIPLLVGTAVDDLPSTISDYQSRSASVRPEIVSMIDRICAELGRTRHRQFGTFSRMFEKVVADHINPPREEIVIAQESDELDTAERLMREGETDKAELIFERLFEESKDDEARAEVRVRQILARHHEHDNAQIFHLNGLDAALKDTNSFDFHFAEITRRHKEAIDAYRRCIVRSPTGMVFGEATVALARRLVRAGFEEEARQNLYVALRSPDIILASAASYEVAKLLEDPFSKSAVLIRGIGLAFFSQVHKLALEVVGEADWHDLHCHLAREYEMTESNGSSKLWLGIAQCQAKYVSLAYQSYWRAMEEGVSVARSNIASILSSGPVPAAGLRLLEEHTDRFDAAVPGAPYSIRAKIEDAIHTEQKAFEEASARGERCAGMLQTFLDRSMASESKLADGSWRVVGKDLELVATLRGAQLDCDLDDLEASALPFCPSAFVIARYGHPRALLDLGSDPPQALSFDLAAQPSWIEWAASVTRQP